MPRPLINVLLVATPRPNAAVLSGIVDQLHARGATVRLATHYDLPDGFFDVRPDEVHSWAKAAASQGPGFRRALRRTQPAKRPWLYAKHDEWVNEQTRKASIIFALDKRSIPFARKLAGRHPGAVAVSDLDDAIRCVQQSGPARRLITSPRSWTSSAPCLTGPREHSSACHSWPNGVAPRSREGPPSSSCGSVALPTPIASC